MHIAFSICKYISLGNKLSQDWKCLQGGREGVIAFLWWVLGTKPFSSTDARKLARKDRLVGIYVCVCVCLGREINLSYRHSFLLLYLIGFLLLLSGISNTA